MRPKLDNGLLHVVNFVLFCIHTWQTMRRRIYKRLPSFQRCVFVSVVTGQLFFLIQSWTYLSSKEVDNYESLQKQNKKHHIGYHHGGESESNKEEVSSATKKDSNTFALLGSPSNHSGNGNGPITKKKNDVGGDNAHPKAENEDDPDRECIFRNSTIYRSVFVYPSPGEPEWAAAAEETGDNNILTEYGISRTELYPWQEIDNRTKTNGEYHYSIRDSRAIQYTLEILVREIITNPKSCLRTYDPSKAKLFYVPYMPRFLTEKLHRNP